MTFNEARDNTIRFSIDFLWIQDFVIKKWKKKFHEQYIQSEKESKLLGEYSVWGK